MQRAITPVFYTVYNNPYGVRELLLSAGFNPDYLKTVNEVYEVSLEYIKQDGDRAIEGIKNLHPDKDWLLNEYCQKSNQSNYNGSDSSDTNSDNVSSIVNEIKEKLVSKDSTKKGIEINIKNEHILMLIVFVIIILILK